MEPAATSTRYLIEITADILQAARSGQPPPLLRRRGAGHRGPEGHRQVDQRERAGHGHSRQRHRRGGLRALPVRAEGRARRRVQGPQGAQRPVSRHRRRSSIDAVRDALYCSKICAYAQGFQLMREAQKEYRWKLDFGAIAAIWRGGCIIRARFLQKITEAYRRDPQPGEPAARSLLQEGARRPAGRLARGGGARRRGTASPRRRSAARSPTSTAIARRACPPICSRRSATTSAPTPTSAWMRPAGSSSTWTGRTRSARSIPSDRARVTAPLTFGTNRFGFPDPARLAATCREAEAAGFSHLWFPDSQLRTGDVFINLLTAARSTERPKVGTLLVNPVTRHPTVLASSIATVDLYAPRPRPARLRRGRHLRIPGGAAPGSPRGAGGGGADDSRHARRREPLAGLDGAVAAAASAPGAGHRRRQRAPRRSGWRGERRTAW